MDWIEYFWLHCHLPSVLVVIHNLNVKRIAVTPGEADAPLVVDPHAVCPGAITLEQFKLVSRRRAEIIQPPGLMQVQELPPRSPFDGLQSADHAVLKESRSIRAFERPDQIPVYDVSGIMSNVIDAEAAHFPSSPPPAVPDDCGTSPLGGIVRNQQITGGDVDGNHGFR